MKLTTRLIILGFCALIFLVAAPAIVFYSLGYRFNFSNGQIITTGGIYVKALPTGVDIAIDNQPSDRTTYFYPSVFVQNLNPGQHQVSISRDGYYAYQKNLEVKEKEVSKLENVTLFQQDMGFAVLGQDITHFSAAPNNTTLLVGLSAETGLAVATINAQTEERKTYTLPLKTGKIASVIWSADSTRALVNIATNYYLIDTTSEELEAVAVPFLARATQVFFNPQKNQEFFYVKDKNIFSTEADLPVAKNILSYHPEPGTANLIWLDAHGSLNITNTTTPQTSPYIAKTLVLEKSATYSVIILGGKTYIKENNKLMLVDTDKNTLVTVYPSVKGMKISPNGQKTLYYNDKEIVLTPEHASLPVATTQTPITTLVPFFSGTVNDVWWINDDYVAVASGNNVVISEIDARGGANVITLPTALPLVDKPSLALQTPQIFFNRENGKLYVFSQQTLAASENLLP